LNRKRTSRKAQASTQRAAVERALASGYSRVPHSFLEGLAAATLNATERSVLDSAVRFSLGFNRLELRLGTDWVSEQTGIDRSNVRRTIRGLVEKGILIPKRVGRGGRGKPNEYVLEPDPEHWSVTWRASRHGFTQEAEAAVSKGQRNGVATDPVSNEKRGAFRSETGSELSENGVPADPQDRNKERKNDRQAAALARGDSHRSPARAAAQPTDFERPMEPLTPDLEAECRRAFEEGAKELSAGLGFQLSPDETTAASNAAWGGELESRRPRKVRRPVSWPEIFRGLGSAWASGRIRKSA
jgi:phage replication O-like protein O